MFLLRVAVSLSVGLVCFLSIPSQGQPQKLIPPLTHQTEHVILITLDGVRWQEIFAGADSTLLFDRTYSSDSVGARKSYWAATPEARRSQLLPFCWNTVATQGQLYGNRLRNSQMNVSNPYWFSYPGYNEILSGYADDRINSNDKINNPNTTVLESLNNQPEFTGKVAAFSSWDVIEAVVNEDRSRVYANSALEPLRPARSAADSLLNDMMTGVHSDFDGVRPDFLTYYAAKNYLRQHQPRVLFISFDETDDLAHAGRYADHLRTLRMLDALIGDLWKTVQQIPRYAGKTTFIITTDHGRGHTPKARWKDHGTKTRDSNQVWLAAIGPDTPATGEQTGGAVLFQNQIAATIARLLGQDFRCEHPVGAPISGLMKP